MNTHTPAHAPDLPCNLVIMGVSGCGKSSLALALCQLFAARAIEGDDFHSASNKAKMQAGVPLTDSDRAGWLTELGQQLASQTSGLVLSCSALKRSYRDQLRQAAPGLRFVFLALEPAQALARVQARAGQHFFNPALVRSQFETLQDPSGEPGVLRLDATLALTPLCQSVRGWLAQDFNSPEILRGDSV